jgi:hypothetical protein
MVLPIQINIDQYICILQYSFRPRELDVLGNKWGISELVTCERNALIAWWIHLIVAFFKCHNLANDNCGGHFAQVLHVVEDGDDGGIFVMGYGAKMNFLTTSVSLTLVKTYCTLTIWSKFEYKKLNQYWGRSPPKHWNKKVYQDLNTDGEGEIPEPQCSKTCITCEKLVQTWIHIFYNH